MPNRRRWLHAAAILVLAAVATAPARAGDAEDFFAGVANDNRRLVQAILLRGFDVNTRNPDGQTALHLALRDEGTEVADLLLSLAAVDVNVRNATGETPLMMAALRGNLPAMRKLLQRGAAAHQEGWSPVHYAATLGGPEAVKLMLDSGAPIEAKSENGTTPLMMAARYGSEDSVALLMQRGADRNKRNDLGMNAADFAASVDREKLAKRLDPAVPWR